MAIFSMICVIIFHGHNRGASLDILLVDSFRVVDHIIIPGRAGRDILQVCVM